jgi:hypothetical protein
MLDDIQRLRSNPSLLQLLSHYADLGKEDREVWQKRLMQLDGVEPSELVKLHGELIAFSWVDQNTGHVPCCYRITLAGQRAIQQIHGGEMDGEELPEMPEKKPFPKFAKKKRAKPEPVLAAPPNTTSDSPEALTVDASEESLVAAS